MNNIKVFRDFFIKHGFEPSFLCKEFGVVKSRIDMQGSLESVTHNVIVEAMRDKTTKAKMLAFYNEQMGLKECSPLQYLQRKYDY